MRIAHPYTNLTGGQWLRGNLHTHTTHSDGHRPTQEVLDDYAQRGYGYLMISDHDIYTSEQDYADHDSKGMVLIPGNEISAQGPHLLHVNAGSFIEPDPDRQNVLDAIAASNSGFAVMNHPNWQSKFDHCSMEQLRTWTGYAGLEIYNATIGRLQGSPYATNKWDMLLGEGRRVWGYANDDSHWPVEDVALGWNTVYVQEPTVTNIVDALANGRFYASTGVTIPEIAVEGNRIKIETDNARRINALGPFGARLAVMDDKRIDFEVPEDAGHVRFECWGDGERFAWTQPFFIEG